MDDHGIVESGEVAQGDAPSVDALQAKIAELEQRHNAERAKLQDEAAQRRIAQREADAARAKALEEQGQWKAAHELRTKELEEARASLSQHQERMRELEVKAQKWDGHVERVQHRVAKEREVLPQEWVEHIDSLGDPILQESAIRVLRSLPSQRVKPAGSESGAAPPSPAVSPTRLRTREDIQRLREADPERYERTVFGESAPKSWWDRFSKR